MKKTAEDQKTELLERAKSYRQAIDHQLTENTSKVKKASKAVVVVGGIIVFFYTFSQLFGKKKQIEMPEQPFYHAPPPERIIIEKEPEDNSSNGLLNMLKEGLTSIILSVVKQVSKDLISRLQTDVFANVFTKFNKKSSR